MKCIRNEAMDGHTRIQRGPVVYEGLCRCQPPANFEGVGTVVSKLLEDIVQPDSAGIWPEGLSAVGGDSQDGRQDLCLPVQIQWGERPYVGRGWASPFNPSRNGYLSEAERQTARCCIRTLQARPRPSSLDKRDHFCQYSRARPPATGSRRVCAPDYLDLRDAVSSSTVTTQYTDMVVLAAAYLGKTPLHR